MEGIAARLARFVAPLVTFTVAVFGLAVVVPVRATAQTNCAGPAPTGVPANGPAGGFHAVTPVRLLDTRQHGGTVGAGCVVTIDVLPVAPVGAAGVALNVTAVDAATRGFVTAYPCGSPRPETSNVNPRVGEPTPNLVIVTLDATRQVCLFTFSATNLVVDATGWFGGGGSMFHEATPVRVVDTRTPQRPDGATGKLHAGSVLQVPLGGPSLPADATGVVVNITVTEPDAPGFATAFPCGTPLPLSSTVNYAAGEDRANQAMVGLGAGATLCVFVLTDTHLVVDVSGWFGPGDGGVPLQTMTASRLVDSRAGTGGFAGAMTPGQTRVLDPDVAGTLPSGAHVVVLNVVATAASAPGYLTVFPCSSAQPPTSSVNYTPGVDATNVVTVTLDSSGKLCVFSFERTQVVIDLLGSFGAPGQLRSLHLSGNPGLGLSGLDPTFRPDVHDYVLHCTCAGGSFDYSATAMPGRALTINGNATGSQATGTTFLAENGAFVVQVGSDQYWVRFLPHDFPTLTAVKTGEVSPGYYLMENGIAGGSGRFLMILDTNGVPVWYRRVNPGEVDFKLLPNGDLASMPLVRTVFNIDPSLGFNERTLDGTLVRTVKAVGSPTDIHDLVLMPNGDYLVVSYRQRTVASLPANFGTCGSNNKVVDGVVQEVTPAGTLVKEWSTQDHVDETSEVLVPLCDSAAGTGSMPPTNAVDYAHINAVDFDAATDQVVVTARHLNAVLWIDWSTAAPKVVRKLGGQGTNPDNPVVFTFAGPGQSFELPHDGRMNADGHLTVFDNEAPPFGTGDPRAAEYALDPADADRHPRLAAAARRRGLGVRRPGQCAASTRREHGHRLGWLQRSGLHRGRPRRQRPAAGLDARRQPHVPGGEGAGLGAQPGPAPPHRQRLITGCRAEPGRARSPRTAP